MLPPRNQQIFKEILTNFHCIIWEAEVIESQEDVLHWSTQVLNEETAMLTVPLELLEGKRYADAFFDAHTHKDRERMDARSAEMIKSGGKRYNQQYGVIDREGQMHWFVEEAQIEPLGEGRWRVFGLANEVTELYLGEEYFKTAIQTMKAPFVLVDVETGTIDTINRAAEKIFGYSASELEAAKFQLLIPEDTHSDQVDFLLHAIQGSDRDMSLRHKDGTAITVQYSTGEFELRGRHKLAIAMQDVSTRRRDEAQKLVLQNIRDEVWNMDHTEDILRVLKALTTNLSRLEIPFFACSVSIIDRSVFPPTTQAYATVKGEDWSYQGASYAGDLILQYAASKEPVYRLDLDAEDRYGERGVTETWTRRLGDRAVLLLGGRHIRSIVDIPFSHGTLALNSLDPEAFSPWHIQFLKEVVDVLSEGFRRAEDLQKLLESEQYLGSVINYLSDGLVIINERLEIESCNPAALNIFGYELDELIGKSIEKLIPPSHDHADQEVFTGFLENNGETGKDQDKHHSESSGRRKNGDIFSIDLAVGVFAHGGGRRLIGLIRDITDRQEEQVRLSQAERMQAIGRLASGVAHEINTPIQYIGHNVSFVSEAFSEIESPLSQLFHCAKDTAAGKDTRRQCETVCESLKDDDFTYLMEHIPQALHDAGSGVALVTEIVQALNETAHPGTGKKIESDLNSIAHNAALVTRNSWKSCADLIEEYDQAPAAIPLVKNEIGQTVINLIVNAVDAIEELRRKSGADEPPLGEIRLRTRTYEGFAELQVTDTGGGIPPEIQDKVFDYFFTTKEPGKGTGQGLAIAYDTVVNKHGGGISIDSEIEHGTAITIRLPIP